MTRAGPAATGAVEMCGASRARLARAYVAAATAIAAYLMPGSAHALDLQTSPSFHGWLTRALVALLGIALGATGWRFWRWRATPTRLKPAYASRKLGPQTIGALGHEGAVYPQPSAPVRVEAPKLREAPHLGVAAAPFSQGFDADAFLAQARVHFARLQAAWDAGSRADIDRLATAPMRDAILAQFDERTNVAARTEIVALEAELLDLDRATADPAAARARMASVRFRGILREVGGEPAAFRSQSFDEVWSFASPDGSQGWMLAGVQRVDVPR